MVFPLSIRDTITALAPASAGGLLSITYTTIVVAYHAFTVPITGPHANSSGEHNRCQITAKRLSSLAAFSHDAMLRRRAGLRLP